LESKIVSLQQQRLCASSNYNGWNQCMGWNMGLNPFFLPQNGIYNSEVSGVPSTSNVSSTCEPQELSDPAGEHEIHLSLERTNQIIQESLANDSVSKDTQDSSDTSTEIPKGSESSLCDPSSRDADEGSVHHAETRSEDGAAAESFLHHPLSRHVNDASEHPAAKSSVITEAQCSNAPIRSSPAALDSTGTKDKNDNRRRSRRERRSVKNNDKITFDDNGIMSKTKRSAAPDKPSEKDEKMKRQKRAKKNDKSTALKDNVGAKTSNGSLESAPSGSANPSMISGIDPQVLSSLVNHVSSTPYYCEESAYRFHNPPFPREGPEQLAVVRPPEMSGKMTPVESGKLDAIPPPKPLPQFPISDHCDWSFDEGTRVLLETKCQVPSGPVMKQQTRGSKYLRY
jgi:hypothetical protein